MITSKDVEQLEDLTDRLVAKVQILGLDDSRLQDVCYDILSEAEKLKMKNQYGGVEIC